MCDVSELFYKVNGKEVEGYLGNPEECEILFVLKEPNANKDNVTDFWFKKVLEKDENEWRKYEAQYFHVLGTMAYRLLGGKAEDATVQIIKNALKRCAYINLHPECGSGSETKEFKKILSEVEWQMKVNNRKRHRKVEEEIINRAQNRINLIKGFPCRYIVTAQNIFCVIAGAKTKQGKDHHEGVILGDKVFRIANIERNKTILSFFPYYNRNYCNADFSKVFDYLEETSK